MLAPFAGFTGPTNRDQNPIADSERTVDFYPHRIDAVNGFSNYSSGLAIGGDRILVATASEAGAQSPNPTSSRLRVRVHRGAEIRSEVD